jgi:hypothetical protein
LKEITVFHIIKSERLGEHQKIFLQKLFHLKTNDDVNINKLLIDISFHTKIRRSFGSKPHKLLIYYESPVKLTRLKTDFLEIINSIDNKKYYDTLQKDESYFTIGNSRIARLDFNEAIRINNLLESLQLTAAPKTTKSKKASHHCNHYAFHNGSNT